MYFSEEGLHLHDRTSQTRTSWQQFVGYLESGDLMLLYYNSRVYRIIPRRALTGQAARFEPMVAAKLSRFDYRNPAPPIGPTCKTQPTRFLSSDARGR